MSTDAPPPAAPASASPPWIAARPRNTLGVVSFVLALVHVALDLIVQVVSYFLPAQLLASGFTAFQLDGVFTVLDVIVILPAAAAIVTGAIALSRRNLPPVLAAMGLAVGVLATFTQLIGIGLRYATLFIR